jgi:hypothetical protein
MHSNTSVLARLSKKWPELQDNAAFQEVLASTIDAEQASLAGIVLQMLQQCLAFRRCHSLLHHFIAGLELHTKRGAAAGAAF